MAPLHRSLLILGLFAISCVNRMAKAQSGINIVAHCIEYDNSEECLSSTTKKCDWYDGYGCYSKEKETGKGDTNCLNYDTQETCSTSKFDCKWYVDHGCFSTIKTGNKDIVHDVATGSLTGPKILVLHSGGGSAVRERASQAFQALMTTLSGFQFVYAQGGYTADDDEGYLWIPDPKDKSEPTTSPSVADASLQILDDIVRTQGPFYGILGFSQGAAFVPIYLAHAPVNTFQVAMMFSGYLTTTHEGLLDLVNDASPFNDITSFVWMGQKDTLITNDMTDEQAAKFTNPVTIVDPTSGHSMPTTKASTFLDITSFVEDNPATSEHQGRDSTEPYPPVAGKTNSSSSSPSLNLIGLLFSAITLYALF